MALYVAICLLAALSLVTNAEVNHQGTVVKIVWGTTIGLAAALVAVRSAGAQRRGPSAHWVRCGHSPPEVSMSDRQQPSQDHAPQQTTSRATTVGPVPHRASTSDGSSTDARSALDSPLRWRSEGATRIRRAPATRPVTVTRDAATKIRRIAVKYVAGVDPAKPSTYDTAGGHSYADHGAQTTKEQHMERLRTGTTPSGRNNKPPPNKPSSKFISDAKHVEALQAATTLLTAKNARKAKIRGSAEVVPVAKVGTNYWRDDTETEAPNVKFDIQPVDDTTLRINSMYPDT